MARKNRANSGPDCYSKYDGKTLLRLSPCSTEKGETILAQLQSIGCAVLNEMGEFQLDCADTEVVCSGEAAATLARDGVASMVSSDAGQFWRESSGVSHSFTETDGLGVASDFYSDWRDLDAQNAHVEAVVRASGGVATLETAGKTFQGRDMKIVRLTGRGYSSGGARVFVSYNIHAREWITGMAGVYAVEQLVEKVKQDPDYLAGTEVILMPMANPDGFLHSTTTDRMHRKNMRNTSSCVGVDLNRNFDVQWSTGGSSSNPCSDTYHGTSAMSEPEALVVGYVLEESQTTVYIDVHSYTQLILTAPGYTSARSPRHAEYRNIGKSIQDAIKATHGITFTEGPAATVLYPAAGCTDDFGDSKGALGITFELRPGRWGGGGFAPPVSEILPSAEECYAGMVAAIDYAKSPPATTTAPPGDCPWHGCYFGCSGTDCQYCESCQ